MVVVMADELVTVTVAVRGHVFAPVTVTVYVPAQRLDAVAPVPPDGAHEYVYGPPPPAVAVTLAVPLHAEHDAAVEDVVSVGPCVTVTVDVAVAVPQLPVPVTVYVVVTVGVAVTLAPVLALNVAAGVHE